MNILTEILKFLKLAFSEKYIKVTFTILFLLLIFINLKTCSKLDAEKESHKQDNEMYQNNIKAINDSITTYYDKELDRMVSEKTSLLIKNVEDLKKYNEDMYEDFKSIKNMVAGIKSDVSVNLPKLIDKNNQAKQDPDDTSKFTIPFDFSYSDKGLLQKIYGESKIQIKNNFPNILYTSLDTNKFKIKLKYALTEKNNKYVVKAISDSKLVEFTEINGAFTIDKTKEVVKNGWVFGPYIGIGLNTDLKGQNSRIGWSGGVSATYNYNVKLKDLFKKKSDK